MSVKQMSAVWEKAATDDPSTLLVMLALADWSNDSGVCWPSMEAIAHKCRISERQAQRIVRELEACDLLEVTRKGGRKHTNVYRLKVPTCQVLLSVKGANETPFIEKGDKPPQERVTGEAGKGDIAASPEPSRSEPSKPEPSKTKAQAPFVLPDWVPKETWDGFEEMRKKIRKPMTDRARNMIVTELTKLQKRGHPPDAVLDQSTRNCWQDVFELRNGGSNGRRENLAGNTSGTNGGTSAARSFAEKNCATCGGSGWDTTSGKAVRCKCFEANRQANASGSAAGR